MKQIAFFLIFLLAAEACHTGNSQTSEDSTNTQQNISATPSLPVADTTKLSGRWNLIPAMASDTAAGKLPYLVFDTIRISGNTGCNNFSGGYLQSGSGLRFDSNMISTRMACPGYDEATFIKNLLQTTGFDKKGDTLVLKEDVTPISYWLKGK